jgi:diguanylate cyclase (GGDEF)-like protein
MTTLESLQPATVPTILIIDDDPALTGFLSILLSDKARIICENSGVAGYILARGAQPDLILLDVIMSDIDGFEVCRKLKADPVTASIPVLFVTAGDDEEIEVRALESGAVDFIAKPLRPAIVRARVETQLAFQRQNVLLRGLAQQDGLTGIHNRRYFDETLNAEFARHRRQQLPLGVALIDVDHFKKFNDGLGHQAGDECLRLLAQSISALVRRPGEVVARFGGEEFGLIIPGCSRSDATRVGEWICKQIKELHIPHPDSVTSEWVTLSLGIAAIIPSPATSAAEMLRLADKALYAAKNGGRDTFVVADG